MNSERLCMSLLSAQSEAAVQAIVEATPEMKLAKNWSAVDNRETNFNVTSNQASDGGKALTELMTNMVDAILLKSAYLKGIDPKGARAPRTMYEAVDKLIKPMRGGKLTSLSPDDGWLRMFATENLAIGVTGGNSKRTGLPCYTFADNGEGQAPEHFPNTFLSLSAGNKKDIGFVQGKYNMGSSGVLGYCGKLGYKLIISKRYDGRSPWGWTLVRRRPASGMPVYEYFRPGNTILSFKSERIRPFHLKNGAAFDGVQRTAGTIVKLYDYQIGSDNLGFRGSREALNENLVETILPFRIFDLRWKPDSKRTGPRAFGVDERSFYGMEWLLLHTHSSTADVAAESEDEEALDEEDGPVDAEGEVSISGIQHPELGEIRIRGVLLKKGPLPKWLKPPKHINRIFHSVHGQVQNKQTRGALSDYGFPALKDRLVMFVDASDLTFEAHNGVWKADREHINQNYWGQLYLEEIRRAIKESVPLRELQQQIAKEELDSSISEQSVELFQKLVDSDKNLAALLAGTPPRLTLQYAGPEGKKQGNSSVFEGRYSPTFVRFDRGIRVRVVEIPINVNYPISATTDAVNQYFDRVDCPGQLTVSSEAAARFSVHRTLKNGKLTVFLKPLEKEVNVGDEVPLTIGLRDDSNAHSDVSDSCRLKIVGARIKLSNPRPPKPETIIPGPIDPETKKKQQPDPSLAMPPFQFLTQDGREIALQWPDGVDQNSGGYVEELGNKRVKFYINYDNAYHIAEKKRHKTEVARKVITEKYKWGMLVNMLSLERAHSALSSDVQDLFKENIDEMRRLGADSAAATVLTLAEILPKILDASSVTDVE